MTSFLFLLAAFFGTARAGQIDGQEKTMARHWQEQLLKMSHLASGDPTTHSRDFFHLSVVMWEVWRVFNATQTDSIIGAAFLPTVVTPLPEPSNAALWSNTEEALGQACFAFLTTKGWPRFTAEIVGNFTVAMNATGLTPDDGSIGARLGRAVQAYAIRNGDPACEAEQYKCTDPNKRRYTTVNPHRCMPLWDGVGALHDPNRWQRLDIGAFIDKAGIQVSGYPDFTTPQFADFEPFSLETRDGTRFKDHTVWFDPGAPPKWGPGTSDSHEQYIRDYSTVAKLSSWFDLLDQTEWSASPADHTLGSNNVFQHTKGCNPDEYREVCANIGTGHEFNPSTGKPYARNPVRRGDYVRIMAEFWSRQFWQNGPESDSPIRQWNTMINKDVFDHPDFQFRYAGGARLSRLEYEIRTYLALNAAFFDSSIAAWSIKRHYDSVRPVTAIRFMSTLGQSTDKKQDSYHPGGLPLIPYVSRLVKKTDICTNLCGNYDVNVSLTAYAPGPLYWLGFHRIGKIAVRSWQPWANVEDDGVAWLPGSGWMPFRRPSFVTPPFPGYVSGHSTYSRAAADILTYITGDHFWPGGLKTQFAQNDSFFAFDSSTFRGGLARDVTLQYATYSDAADECAISRLYAGAHIPADDVPARHIGRMVAERVWNKLTSKQFFDRPIGQRVAVRFVAAEGSDTAALVEWAKSEAVLAHQTTTGTQGNDIQVQVIGRGPGEPERSRTVIIGRTSQRTAKELQTRLDKRAESSEILTCTDLACEPESMPLSGGAIAGIVFGSLLLLAVIGLAVALVLHRVRLRRAVVSA
jgi:hypothetical protein